MSSNQTYIIIQARLASTRLPEKIILDFFEGKGILEVIIDRIKTIIPPEQIIIATSEENRNNAIELIAQKTGVKYYEGSENNVLKRFIDAANTFGAKKIIRLCSDNPFLSLEELKRLYDYAQECKDKVEYASFWIDGKPSILTHYGLWTEYVSLQTLEKVTHTTEDKLYLEHVTNYVHRHPNQFNIEWLQPSIELLDSVRLTTDTEEDFNNQKSLFKEVVHTFGAKFTTHQVIDFLKENQKFVTAMRDEIINNAK